MKASRLHSINFSVCQSVNTNTASVHDHPDRIPCLYTNFTSFIQFLVVGHNFSEMSSIAMHCSLLLCCYISEIRELFISTLFLNFYAEPGCSGIWCLFDSSYFPSPRTLTADSCKFSFSFS